MQQIGTYNVWGSREFYFSDVELIFFLRFGDYGFAGHLRASQAWIMPCSLLITRDRNDPKSGLAIPSNTATISLQSAKPNSILWILLWILSNHQSQFVIQRATSSSQIQISPNFNFDRNTRFRLFSLRAKHGWSFRSSLKKVRERKREKHGETYLGISLNY